MDFHLIAVGRLREPGLRAAFDTFQKRLGKRLSVQEIVLKRNLPAGRQADEEGVACAAAVPASAACVALDGRGKALSSEAFADRLAAWQDGGIRRVCFVIGGAYGHGQAIIDRADLILSLGPMTWPHLLVRVMLAEQLYRATCILSGHPYHHGD